MVVRCIVVVMVVAVVLIIVVVRKWISVVVVVELCGGDRICSLVVLDRSTFACS